MNIILSVFLEQPFYGILKEKNILAICDHLRGQGVRLKREVLEREKLAFMRVRECKQ